MPNLARRGSRCGETIHTVILSAAKNPHLPNERFFAALRMTGEDVLPGPVAVRYSNRRRRFRLANSVDQPGRNTGGQGEREATALTRDARAFCPDAAPH